MKITYEFDTMSEDYDLSEHEIIKQSTNFYVALVRIQDTIRSWVKYNSCPIIDEHTFYWDDLSEEKKAFYKENKIPDIDKMAEEIYGVIDSAGVNMDKIN